MHLLDVGDGFWPFPGVPELAGALFLAMFRSCSSAPAPKLEAHVLRFCMCGVFARGSGGAQCECMRRLESSRGPAGMVLRITEARGARSPCGCAEKASAARAVTRPRSCAAAGRGGDARAEAAHACTPTRDDLATDVVGCATLIKAACCASRFASRLTTPSHQVPHTTAETCANRCLYNHGTCVRQTLQSGTP